MAAAKKHVFLSYAHADHELTSEVYRHLNALQHVQVWRDVDSLRAGDAWHNEIDKALARSHVVLLLISANFLGSAFIRQHEIPRIQRRHRDRSVIVIPCLLAPCSWRDTWIAKLQFGTPSDLALSEIGVKGSASLDRVLAGLAAKVSETIPPEPAEELESPLAPDERVGALFRRTLLRHLGADGDVLAHKLTAILKKVTGLHDDTLFDAGRYCVEYHLLRFTDITTPLLLELSAGDAKSNVDIGRLVSELKQATARGFRSEPITVETRFFSRAREREEEWKCYFEALAEPTIGGCAPTDVRTLCQVRALGFVAPQFLVTGLLARCDDNWDPVLKAYARSIPEPRFGPGSFQALQASQWNCWLVWGPSIPVCTCAEWKGLFALQFGYGDENNSLPIIDLSSLSGESCLSGILEELMKEQRQAKLGSLLGRMRWAPWCLRESTETEDTEAHAFDPDAWDHQARQQNTAPVDAPQVEKLACAPAQRMLYAPGAPAYSTHRDYGDGLFFDVEEVPEIDPRLREPPGSHTYFSAYRWAIFLVCTAAESSAGPALLRDKQYPPWPEPGADRVSVRSARLWEDLIPVFVHANIADAPALRFQKRALASACIQLLKDLWVERHELFAESDVEKGIRFQLVNSFDYSGCGCAIRYPNGPTSFSLMRELLAREPDAEFASSVVLPANDGSPVPWGLAGYYSSCHLPELIDDYYTYVRRPAHKRAASGTR